MQGNTKLTEKEMPYVVENHIGRSQVKCLLSSYDQAIASREIKPVNDRKIYGNFEHEGLVTSDELISLLAEEFLKKYSTNQHQERLAYFFSEIREKKKKLQMFQNKSIKLSIVMQKIVTQFFRYKNLIRKVNKISEDDLEEYQLNIERVKAKFENISQKYQRILEKKRIYDSKILAFTKDIKKCEAEIRQTKHQIYFFNKKGGRIRR